MAITKIEVSYGRTIQPREYESKNASAVIGVALDEGEVNTNLELRDAMRMAVSVVHDTLGLAAPVEATGRSISDNPEDRQDPEQAKELTPGQKSAATRKANKAKKEAEQAEQAEEVFDITDEDIDAHGTEDTPDEPDEITDAELSAEINGTVKHLKANGHPSAPATVKAAIAAFNSDNQDNFTAGMMTQAQRRKFLNKLDAIPVPEAA